MQKKLLVALGLALVTVLALGLLQYYAARRLATDSDWVAHSQEVLRELAAVQRYVNAADACTQAFVLTGTGADLPACDPANGRAIDSLRTLRSLSADNPSQQHNVAKLEGLVGDNIRVLRQEMDYRKAGEIPAPKLAALEVSVRESIRDVRTLIDAMQSEEQALLIERREAADRSRHQTNWLIFWGNLTAILLLSVSGAALVSEVVGRHSAEHTLQESEERLRFVVEGVQDYAIFLLDPAGRVSSWNIGAERIKGYKSSEILGKHFSCLYPAEDIAVGKPDRHLETAAREGHVDDEGWRVRKDGSKFWARTSLTSRKDAAGKLIGFVKITRDITERMRAVEALRNEVAKTKEAQEQLAESEKSLRQLSIRLLRAQDDERRRLGREMHDSLGQFLSVLKMKLDVLALSMNPLADSEGARREIAHCAELAAECMREVRTMSYLLYPPMLEEMGLKVAIQWCLEGFTGRSGVQTTFDVSEGFDRLEHETELALFRVLQEALTNVHKHSGSATAAIRLVRSGDTVVLEVSDQGKLAPVEVSKQPPSDSFATFGVGLRSMTERLSELGGTLTLTANPDGAGTTLRATVPVREEIWRGDSFPLDDETRAVS